MSYRHYIIIFALFLLGTIDFFFISPPSSFPLGSTIKIPAGVTLRETADFLHEKGFVRSPISFEIASRVFHRGEVVAGQYSFTKPQNIFSLSQRVAAGDFEINAIKVTVPEGSTRGDIGKILAANIPGFNEGEFLSVSASKEGYLFPDTYFFPPLITPEEVISQMTKNFEVQTKDLATLISKSGHSWNEAVIMGSILEEEGSTPESRRMIAGILWKRIEKNIPLQVDATFLVINGKSTFDLTQDDLFLKSPYNTYRNKGLPPAPISNPGLDSIRAALEPTDSPYLYYLSDNQGNMHYAADFEGHKKNKSI